jgi:hypothetical protein
MRDSLKAKAARYSVQHEKDCGTCANCLAVELAKQSYVTMRDAPRDTSESKVDRIKRVGDLLRVWLVMSRERRCTGGDR